MCFSFITNAGVTSLPMDIVVYAADGAGGSPGTELGRKSVTANVVAIGGVPFTPTFQSFDLSDLNLNIASAHVATFGERVVDVFYVTDLFGAKIAAPTRQATIKRALLALFAPPEAVPKPARALAG